MIVCIISNSIFAIFSIDYLRKMENNTEIMYGEKLLAVNTISDIEVAFLTGDSNRLNEIQNLLENYKFDSKMEFYIKDLNSSLESEDHNKIITTVQEMKQYVIDRAESQMASYQKDISFGYKLLASVSVVIILIIIYFSIRATRAVNIPTRQLKNCLKRLNKVILQKPLHMIPRMS